VLIVKIIVK